MTVLIFGNVKIFLDLVTNRINLITIIIIRKFFTDYYFVQILYKIKRYSKTFGDSGIVGGFFYEVSRNVYIFCRDKKFPPS